MGPLLKGMLTQGNEESTAQSASTFFWAVIDKKKARSQSQVRNLEGKYLIPGFWALRSKPWDKIWQAFPTPGNPDWNPNWIWTEQERTNVSSHGQIVIWIGYGISICQTQQQYQPTVRWQCMLFEPVQSDFTYLRRSGNQLCNDRYEANVAKTRNPKTYDCYISEYIESWFI